MSDPSSLLRVLAPLLLAAAALAARELGRGNELAGGAGREIGRARPATDGAGLFAAVLAPGPPIGAWDVDSRASRVRAETPDGDWEALPCAGRLQATADVWTLELVLETGPGRSERLLLGGSGQAPRAARVPGAWIGRLGGCEVGWTRASRVRALLQGLIDAELRGGSRALALDLELVAATAAGDGRDAGRDR